MPIIIASNATNFEKIVEELLRHQTELPIELQKTFYGLSNTPLFYVSYCKKLNADHKVQRRVTICTLDHFYVCHPNGDVLRCFPFHMIERIIHDPIRSQLAIVVPEEYDVAIEVPNTYNLIFIIESLRSIRSETADAPLIIQHVLRTRKDPKNDGLPARLLGYPPAILDGEGTATGFQEDDYDDCGAGLDGDDEDDLNGEGNNNSHRFRRALKALVSKEKRRGGVGGKLSSGRSGDDGVGSCSGSSSSSYSSSSSCDFEDVFYQDTVFESTIALATSSGAVTGRGQKDQQRHQRLKGIGKTKGSPQTDVEKNGASSSRRTTRFSVGSSQFRLKNRDEPKGQESASASEVGSTPPPSASFTSCTLGSPVQANTNNDEPTDVVDTATAQKKDTTATITTRVKNVSFANNDSLLFIEKAQRERFKFRSSSTPPPPPADGNEQSSVVTVEKSTDSKQSPATSINTPRVAPNASGGGENDGGAQSSAENAGVPFIEQMRDWWYYFRRAVPSLPLFSLYPSGVIINWNDKYYVDPKASERVRRREQRAYKAQYERKLLFRWLFWRERQGRVRMSIHNPLMPASEEALINTQAFIDSDPFAFGENIAGHPNEVCIGKGPYAVRLEKPRGFRLCLYTGRGDGDEEEFDINDDGN